MPDGGSGLTDADAEAILRDLQLSGKMRYIKSLRKEIATLILARH
jgi:hypothetical protein